MSKTDFFGWIFVVSAHDGQNKSWSLYHDEHFHILDDLLFMEKIGHMYSFFIMKKRFFAKIV